MTSVLDSIGDTPLVKLEHLVDAPDVEVWVKLEYFSPSCSVKDRIVRHIVDDAEERGLLRPGGVIVENTSGNTGAAAAMIGAARGYRVVLTMPDKVSDEKQNALTAYGAEIVVCPTEAPPDSPDHYVVKARAIAEQTPDSFRIDQYDNPKNPEAHYLSTGPEIWRQTEGRVTHFVASGSTGGTVTGVARYLKEQKPDVHVLMPDPVGSIYYEYFKTGVVPEEGSCTYQVEGIGEDHIAEAMDFSVVDEMVQFDDRDAFLTARRLARQEGILGGGSTGANVWAALRLAGRLDGPATIVTIAPDSGIKYLSKIYNDDWMREQGLLDERET